MNVVTDRIRELLIFFMRHAFQIGVVLDAVIDDMTHNVVRLTERNAFAGKVVGKVRGVGVAAARALAGGFRESDT